MARMIWAKLWIDILDDPKVAGMPDWLFRRFIFFILAAKEYGHDGLLQPVNDLAWRIRCSAQEATDALSALAKVGVTINTIDGWKLINFVKRQERDVTDSAIRMRRLRERKKESDRVTNDIISDVTCDASHSISVSVSDSISPLNDQPKLFSIHDAEKAYLQVTRFVTVPGGLYEYLGKILDMLDSYGWDGTVTRLTKALTDWKNQVRKDNHAPYKVTNPRWIDNAIAGETIGVEKLSDVDRINSEIDRMARRTQ